MTPEHLKALLARVEGARGPDRELDARIEAALMQGQRGDHLRALIAAEFASRKVHEREFWILRASDWQAPKYTASLDAALALVERQKRGPLQMLHEAQLSLEARGYRTDQPMAPQLALAVILVLLESMEEAQHA